MTLLDFEGLAIFWFPKTELFDHITDGVIDKIIEVSHTGTSSSRSAPSAILTTPETSKIQHSAIRRRNVGISRDLVK